VLYVEIGPDGMARNMRVIRGLGLGLDQKAIEAVSTWQFKPGARNGVPVTVQAMVEVNFRLL
jgi:TonB family protein